MRTGTASLEAAQIVAAQEEPVDDFLTAAGKQVQVSGTGSELDTPIRVPELAFQRNIVSTVHVAAEETGIAAKASVVIANFHDIPGMRDEFAVAVVERNDLTDLRQKRPPRLVANEGTRAKFDVEDLA